MGFVSDGEISDEAKKARAHEGKSDRNASSSSSGHHKKVSYDFERKTSGEPFPFPVGMRGDY